MLPAEQYLYAVAKAKPEWLFGYRNIRVLECGLCFRYETRPSPAGKPKSYRRSLHGCKHSIGNDGKLPFHPDMLVELPLQGDERCQASPEAELKRLGS